MLPSTFPSLFDFNAIDCRWMIYILLRHLSRAAPTMPAMISALHFSIDALQLFSTDDGLIIGRERYLALMLLIIFLFLAIYLLITQDFAQRDISPFDMIHHLSYATNCRASAPLLTERVIILIFTLQLLKPRHTISSNASLYRHMYSTISVSRQPPIFIILRFALA